MGLTMIDERASLYCSLVNDRSLTNSLLESSAVPLKCSKQFSHSPVWAEGIDLWSSSPVVPSTTTLVKKESTRYPMEFHCDLGLYLPRHEKPLSAPLTTKYFSNTSSKVLSTELKPERLRLLIKKEKDLLRSVDPQPLRSSFAPLVPANSNRSDLSIDAEEEEKPTDPNGLNNERLKNFLKEHLTEMLTRGSTHLQRDQRDEEEHVHPRTEMPSTRKLAKCLEEKTSFGFRVTPVGLVSPKQFQSISLEKMAQQRNSQADLHHPQSPSSSSSSSSPSSTSSTPTISSPNISRPSTQPQTQNPSNTQLTTMMMPVGPSSLLRRYPIGPGSRAIGNQQRIRSKQIFANEISSNDLFLLNESTPKSTVEQPNPKKNAFSSSSTHRHPHRSHHHHHQQHHFKGATTTTTIDLLPPIISGKRLHIPAAHHRYL